MVIDGTIGLRLACGATAARSVGRHCHEGDRRRVFVELHLNAVGAVVKFTIFAKLLSETSEHSLHKSLWVSRSICRCSSFAVNVLPSVLARALSSFAVTSA